MILNFDVSVMSMRDKVHTIIILLVLRSAGRGIYLISIFFRALCDAVMSPATDKMALHFYTTNNLIFTLRTKAEDRGAKTPKAWSWQTEQAMLSLACTLSVQSLSWSNDKQCGVGLF